MKVRLAIFLVSFLLVTSQWAEERPWINRETLLSLKGDSGVAAKELLESIDAGEQSIIRSKINNVIARGNWEVVALLLRYKSTTARREAAVALGKIKSPDVALKLLEALDVLELPVMGGDESTIEQRDTRRIYEDTLSKITGVKVNPSWTSYQKRTAFREWIDANTARSNSTPRPSRKDTVK